MGRMDTLIDKMYDVLNAKPARSRYEIANKLDISEGYVSTLMTIVRKNSDYYTWTIPHAQRGINGNQDNRFHIVHCNRDGVWEIDEDAHADARLGAVSTITSIITQQNNE